MDRRKELVAGIVLSEDTRVAFPAVIAEVFVVTDAGVGGLVVLVELPLVVPRELLFALELVRGYAAHLLLLIAFHLTRLLLLLTIPRLVEGRSLVLAGVKLSLPAMFGGIELI